MNQDDFRKLLGSGQDAGSLRKVGPRHGHSRLLSHKPQPPAAAQLHPRKVETTSVAKQGLNASEIEIKRIANAEEFEKLGSAKGLDLRLVAQIKAKEVAGSSTEDDTLESAYREVAESRLEENGPLPSRPKRTRKDLVQEVKKKRLKGAHDDNHSNQTLFTPISSSIKTFPVLHSITQGPLGVTRGTQIQSKAPAGSQANPLEPPAKEPGDMAIQDEKELDIFPDVGEYDGVGDVEGDISTADTAVRRSRDVGDGNKWFQERKDSSVTISTSVDAIAHVDTAPSQEISREADQLLAERLQPLATTSIPSISDFVALDKELSDEEKRKARRDKRKGRRQQGSG